MTTHNKSYSPFVLSNWWSYLCLVFVFPKKIEVQKNFETVFQGPIVVILLQHEKYIHITLILHTIIYFPYYFVK
jgi:hypothetical protein